MGLFLLDLADVLRGAGLTVVEVPGWRTRGWRGGSTPDGGLRGVRGGLIHHTGTSTKAKGDYPSLAIVRDGRGGPSPVPGPLAQLGLGRSGTWYTVAAGRANHAGAVDQVDYSNPEAIGVEAEHPGDTSPWPQEQYASYVTGAGALADRYGIVWRGHKEAAVPAGRKIDPRFDMDAFRAAVAASRGTGIPSRGDARPPASSWTPAVLPELINQRLQLAGFPIAGRPGDYDRGAVTRYQRAQLFPTMLADGLWGPATEAHFGWTVELQAALAGVGGHLNLDGSYGPQTRLTVENFQRATGLVVDGQAGPITCARLGIRSHP